MSNRQQQVAALWEELKALMKSVVEEMNQSADLRVKTGGLEFELGTNGQILISKHSRPRMYVTVDLRPSSIDVATRMLFDGPQSAERQFWESLAVKTDGDVSTLRNKTGESLTADQAVYYILRPFLHLGTLSS